MPLELTVGPSRPGTDSAWARPSIYFFPVRPAQFHHIHGQGRSRSRSVRGPVGHSLQPLLSPSGRTNARGRPDEEQVCKCRNSRPPLEEAEHGRGPTDLTRTEREGRDTSTERERAEGGQRGRNYNMRRRNEMKKGPQQGKAFYSIRRGQSCHRLILQSL